MAAPGSERTTYRWLWRHSALGEMIGTDYESMSLMQLYRASDTLMAPRQEIERHLFNELADLFGLSCTVTLYDLTNTYFEGEAAGQPKAKRGVSKEKRSDCPLLTLGLVLDGSGFVRGSQVFDGNVREAKTLKGMLAGFNAPKNALVIMDHGIATEDNLAWLRKERYCYLVVSRERTRSFDFDGASTVATASGQTVHVKKLTSEEGDEVRLYCYSEQRADARTLHVRKSARAEPDQLAIYQALRMDPAPGGVWKMIV